MRRRRRLGLRPVDPVLEIPASTAQTPPMADEAVRRVLRRPGEMLGIVLERHHLTGALLNRDQADWIDAFDRTLDGAALRALAADPLAFHSREIRLALPVVLARRHDAAPDVSAAVDAWFMGATAHTAPQVRRDLLAALCAPGAAPSTRRLVGPVAGIIAADEDRAVRASVTSVLLHRIHFEAVSTTDERLWLVPLLPHVPVEDLAHIHRTVTLAGPMWWGAAWEVTATLHLTAPVLAVGGDLDAIVLALAFDPDPKVLGGLVQRLAGLVPYMRRGTVAACLTACEESADPWTKAYGRRYFPDIWSAFAAST